MERVSRHDEDQRTLGDMFADLVYDRHTAVVVSQSAYQATLYELLLHAVSRMRFHPRLIVLPVNIRSFSPQWYFNPSWQFMKERALLQRYAATPGASIQLEADDEPTAMDFELFDAVNVNYPCSPFDRVGQFRLIVNSRPETEEQRRFRSQQIFVFHYMNPLSSEHALLAALKGLLAMTNRLGVLTLVYLTPINYQAGLRFVGEEFVGAVSTNIHTLEQALEEAIRGDQIAFLDYSQFLSSDYFFHPDLATEHLNQSGRLMVAEELSRRAFSMLNGATLS